MTLSSIAIYYWNNPAEMALPFSLGFGIWAGLRGNTSDPHFSKWAFRFTIWSLMFIYGLVTVVLANGMISFAILTIATGIALNEVIDNYNMKAAIAGHRLFIKEKK